jgi:hypothetical protein
VKGEILSGCVSKGGMPKKERGGHELGLYEDAEYLEIFHA